MTYLHSNMLKERKSIKNMLLQVIFLVLFGVTFLSFPLYTLLFDIIYANNVIYQMCTQSVI